MVLVSPSILAGWQAPPSLLVAALMGAAGVCGIAGHYFLIRAHTIAPASTLSPFVYSQLVWMVALGYFVFGDMPGMATLAGAAVIIASGLYILYRERVRGGA